ncbi:MAG: hypothetical protein JJE39_08585 [Vicinamibacteria bacterium]|nr:hypothetical protein [Vicinamibacteria bacterium]
MRFLPAVALLGLFFLGATQANGEEPRRNAFFVRGYSEAGVMTPHNEMDLNLRRPDLLETNGFGDNFARYAVRGQIFFGRKFANGPVREVFVLVKPELVMGRTIPQIQYTWSARPIGYVKDFGAGVSLGRDWSIYFESHRWSFRDKVAITGDGPYGFHNIVIVRKTFNFTF